MSKVIWSNDYFEIGPSGITWVDQNYHIAASRLLEETERDGVRYYDWPIHLLETNRNFPIVTFEEAFRRALVIHKSKYGGGPDIGMLDRSFAAARQYDRLRNVWSRLENA